ncbi:hypothetical protein GE061_017715 [Apolygus lucorum]|uniref:Gustatory receptor n=1 Tax=Apolygus lucorum TaxID=248454 RepID=A0A8S9XBT0_APOLU|nr:hypothetical protein GE061_017715 [Apolygus lucorum]
MPQVSGKLQDDYRHLSFSAWSLNSVYSIIVIIAALYLSLKTFAEAWYATDGDFNLARQFAFNFVSTSYLICYYRLAGRWKNIMKIWSGFDQKMAHFYRVEFTKRVALFTAVYSLTSITWATYLQKPHQIINIFLTVSWNFTDVFISSISIALSSKFEQFNLELAHSSKNKGHSVAYWKLMRETYNQLALFTKFLDKNLSMFVILSFFNNLFFVCFQLLNTLGTCSVCLCAASIYENSKKPIKMLFMVPSETYNVEVHRLLLQVLLDRQTLSGFNFFYITKGLLLTVAGTILTYEIFLVQLDNLKEDGPEDNYIEGC